MVCYALYAIILMLTGDFANSIYHL